MAVEDSPWKRSRRQGLKKAIGTSDEDLSFWSIFLFKQKKRSQMCVGLLHSFWSQLSIQFSALPSDKRNLLALAPNRITALPLPHALISLRNLGF